MTNIEGLNRAAQAKRLANFRQRLRTTRQTVFAGGDVQEALAQLDDVEWQRIAEAQARFVRWMADYANGDLPKPRKRRR